MKVAIIGAGISGLSCAHELKRHGIIPTIFEKKGYIGEMLEYQSIIINMFNFPQFGDPFKHIKKNYNIDIMPQYTIKEMVSHSPNKKVYYIKGKSGYVLKRGMASDSVENQLAQSVNLPVRFNTYVHAGDIIDDFDHIVVASGTSIIPNELGIFTTTFNAYTRIATVLGDFKTDSVSTWWALEYCKNGFAYLVPYGPGEARIILVVNGITYNELGYYWEEFLRIENIGYIITETRDWEHNVGFVEPVQLGNMYFAGNAGGFIDDLLGFSIIKAIVSGVNAARAIVNHQSYDKMMQPFKEDVKRKHEMRTVENTWDNKVYDGIFALVHLPGIKQFIFNTPFFKLTHLTFLAKMYNYVWRRTKKPY